MHPFMTASRTHLSCVLLTVLVTAGCSTISREAAIHLSSEGGVAAKSYQESLNTTRKELERYVEGQYMLSPLTGRAEPTKDMLASITQIDNAFALRAAMMSRLGAVYVAFNNLASYDAGAEVEAAVTGFTGAVNAYAAVVSPGANPISDVAGKLAARGAGFLANWEQSRRLKQASILVRERLEPVIGLLDKERTLYDALRTEIVTGSGRSAIALWNIGIGRPDSILEEQLGTFGLLYDKDHYERHLTALSFSDRDNLKKAIASIIRHRVDRRISLETQLIEGSQEGFQMLIAAHRKLENGKELTLETFTAHLIVIRKIGVLVCCGFIRQVRFFQQAFR